MRLAVTLALVLTCMLASCGDDDSDLPDRDTSARPRTAGVDTSARLTKDLPAGRFQLPTNATPAPDLWISLPDGYRVKGASDRIDDRFYVVHTKDPSLTDTSAVTPGFMLIYVGATRQNPFTSVKTKDGERVLVVGQPLQWRLAEDSLPDGGRYYQRDIGSHDIFARLSSKLASTPLHLHIYVAGSDSTRVADLMRSAESISIVP